MDGDRTTRSGTTLLAGRYRLLDVLGRGGVADVHRAVDELLGREVAVKLVRSDAPDPDALERFAAETRTHAGLSHPNLVTVLDAGAAGSRPFLVMELVEGRTLADIVERPSDVDVVARFGAGIAAGLSHVHERGVVHRDLKPANVLLGDDGRVALSDFGVARLLDSDPGHTSTGFTVGTAAYFAPEQVTGSAVTPAADIYSLALVLLEALTGRRAYPGPPAQAALARLRHDPELPPGLPVPLRDLLRRMTAADPTVRPSARRVEQVLLRLATRAPVRPVPIRPVPIRPTPVRTSIHPPSPRLPVSGREPTGRDPRGADPAVGPGPVMVAVLAVLTVIGAILLWAVVGATRDAGTGDAASDLRGDRHLTQRDQQAVEEPG